MSHSTRFFPRAALSLLSSTAARLGELAGQSRAAPSVRLFVDALSPNEDLVLLASLLRALREVPIGKLDLTLQGPGGLPIRRSPLSASLVLIGLSYLFHLWPKAWVGHWLSERPRRYLIWAEQPGLKTSLEVGTLASLPDHGARPVVSTAWKRAFQAQRAGQCL